jgi:hypothetical protein
MTHPRVVKLHFRVLPHRINVEQLPRTAFWEGLRNRLAASGEDRAVNRSAGIPTSDTECEKLLYKEFGPALEKHFNGQTLSDNALEEALKRLHEIRPPSAVTYESIQLWHGVRFGVASIQYHSLTLGVLVAGTKEVLDMVDRYPDVFQELLLGFAPPALDEALGAPVSMFLETSIDVTRPPGSVSSGAPAMLVRQLRPFVPLLVALAVLFLLAYNEYMDARNERTAVAAREGQFIDRQQKLLDMQAARIAGLEGYSMGKCENQCNDHRPERTDVAPPSH